MLKFLIVLLKLTQKYRDEILRQLNKALVAKTTRERFICSRKLRIDTTVAKSNVHYPTDAQLLADGIKFITRQVKRIRKVVAEFTKEIVPKVTDRCCPTKKCLLQIGKVLKRRTKETIKDVREITRKLADRAIKTVIETKKCLTGQKGC